MAVFINSVHAEENQKQLFPDISDESYQREKIKTMEDTTDADYKIHQNHSLLVPERIEENDFMFSQQPLDLLPLKKTDIKDINKDLETNQPLAPKLDNSNSGDNIYKSPPQAVPKDKVPAILTTFSLNDLTVNHLTKAVVDTQFVFGTERTDNLYINALYQIESKVIQSLSQDNIFTSDFQGEYLQLRTINQNRQISIIQSQPQTLRGFELQQTFIGPCYLVNNDASVSGEQCNLLPPFVVDRKSIEPRFFVPNRIEQLGNIGDVISPETLALIKLPGWQNQGFNGEFTGIDLYLPNIGATPGNSQSNQTAISRRESLDNTYSLGHYQVRQIVKTNAQKAVLGRTIKGVNVIVDDENLGLNSALGALGAMLPDIKPNLKGTAANANTNINRNLFNAANNIRVPGNSFVIYQGGVGEAVHNQINVNNGNGVKRTSNIPAGKFNSVWLGISPVTKRSFSQTSRYVPTGEERRVLRVGGEGGINSDVNFAVATNENGISNSINSANLNNFYIQAYMSLLQRDVNFETVNILNKKTNYYPHLSLTGNITNYNSVLRYYTGAIFSENVKLYVGGDYTINWDNWLLNLGAIAYNSGDKDYYSKVEGSLSKQFRFSPNTNLGLFTGFRYAWDRDQDNFLDNPVDNFVSVGANLNFNIFSLQISQLLDLLPDSTGNKIQASLTASLGKNASFTAYFSPQRSIDSYGISSRYSWGDSANRSSISFNWGRNIYDFGDDAFGENLQTKNDTFSVIFQAFFK
ncbi:hypothetical protein [Sphaerospermopsis sp. FACHB-1194]|uniref:hypothetical protein n=1 Tax=Sphaerospermopsis sp. FACHB-1194 TaxID=2692862 RepID=UPI00168035E3|nr:hypothetical protein [Sphaerospermopsis sp. FACHB-1194]MBD2148143.1 hypothetical protein [Sphaerospermopsis sp. FACHB-1194]